MPHIEIIARGLWRRGDTVLLCRNLDRGYAYLPGGHVEFGEPAAAALRREFVEETGLVVDVGPPLLVLENRFGLGADLHHEMNLVFHVEHPGCDVVVESREKGIGFEFVRADLIGSLDVRPAPLARWVAEGCAGGVGWLSHFS